MSFEAPERSGLQQLRWSFWNQARRGIENRLLDAAYVAGYLSRQVDHCKPQARAVATQATAIVINKSIGRWLLIWTLAAIWLCY